MGKPNFKYENNLWRKGFEFVAGADEVGRGCFAGPVVAASVVFPKIGLIIPDEIKINDSKKLTAKQREISSVWIKENSLMWGVGEASVYEINNFGMTKATSSAFRRSVSRANVSSKNRIQFLLIDAFYIQYINGIRMPRKSTRKNKNLKDSRATQLAIIKGDAKSVSIAAASIIAKVYRDDLMQKLGKRENYQKYDWINNKGYGTKNHRDAILKYGITKHHRKIFVDTFLSKSQ